MKIAILGYSGAGKSTLAKQLAAQLGCPALHLDAVHFLPGWAEREDEEARALVAAFLDEQDAWVIDGSYRKLCWERRMAEADRILLLLLPRWLCFWRALRRYWRERGGVRDDMAPGCPEKFDLEFGWWLVWQGRTRARRAGFEAVVRSYGEKVTVCRSPGQVRALLERGLWR